MKDLAKRKRVMQRSMQLGHCICNAQKACPCDLFREKDLCPCAGEHDDGAGGPVRLMSLVANAGCASKIDKGTLDRVLRGLPFLDDPRVLVGAPAGDDAGVYRLTADTALVQTVDVFSPAVDDPYLFGQIAAANSLSDVYAMGGRPITSLSIVGFPLHTVPDDVLHQILRGGIDKMTEAGVPVVGGHSINDRDIKAGFAVTGVVHPDRIMTNAKAQPGDRLILTKPLGTGILSFAVQIGRAPSGSAEAAARTMASLNRDASQIMLECGAHACTDVTGFGLMGHLGAMASAAGVDVEVVWDDLPLLPGVLECLAAGIASGAVERNREASEHRVAAGPNITPPMLDLCFDPQTSGGLLVAIPEAVADRFLSQLHAAAISEAVSIGRVLSTGQGRVRLQSNGQRAIPAHPAKATTTPTNAPAATREIEAIEQRPAESKQNAIQESYEMSCCENGHDATLPNANPPGNVPAIQQKFQEFLKAANAPGALNEKTKQAIAIALSVMARCEPCVKSHIKKARQTGFTQDEIDEAAWMAISFAGSPAMVFYNALRLQ